MRSLLYFAAGLIPDVGPLSHVPGAAPGSVGLSGAPSVDTLREVELASYAQSNRAALQEACSDRNRGRVERLRRLWHEGIDPIKWLGEPKGLSLDHFSMASLLMDRRVTSGALAANHPRLLTVGHRLPRAGATSIVYLVSSSAPRWRL